MLTHEQIKAHYATHGIRDTIIRVSSDNGNYRAGNWDFENWYKYSNGKKIKLCLANPTDYTNMISNRKCRTLYWTLNYFDPEIFNVDYTAIPVLNINTCNRRSKILIVRNHFYLY